MSLPTYFFSKKNFRSSFVCLIRKSPLQWYSNMTKDVFLQITIQTYWLNIEESYYYITRLLALFKLYFVSYLFRSSRKAYSSYFGRRFLKYLFRM